MRYRLLCAISLFGLSLSAVAPSIPAQAPARPFRLDDGTPVRLRLTRTISSAEAHVNEMVDFEVLEEVKVNDAVVIPKGSVALGEVTEAREKRRMGRGGKLQVEIESVRLTDGEKAPLRALRDVKGSGKKGKMTVGIVATGIGFFPAAPLFLLMHGKEATVPKDTQFTAYIQGDIALEPARFGVKTTVAETTTKPIQPAPPSQAAPVPPPTKAVAPPSTPAIPVRPSPTPQPATVPPAAASSTEELSSVAIKSNPDSTEIYLDGKFVGSTPTTVRIGPGDHILVLERQGFKQWLRYLTVTPGGNVTVDATLEKTP